jgi:hypothetical protein
MKTFYNSRTFSEDPIHKLDFLFALNDERTKNVCLHLSYGGVEENKFFVDGLIHYHLNTETPNVFINYNTREIGFFDEKRFNKIFSICPYLVQKRNRILNNELYICISSIFRTIYFAGKQKNN